MQSFIEIHLTCQHSEPPTAQSATHKLRIIRIYSYLPQYLYYGLTGKQRVGVVYVKEAWSVCNINFKRCCIIFVIVQLFGHNVWLVYFICDTSAEMQTHGRVRYI